MKINWIKHEKGKTYTNDISQVVSSIIWSGSVSQAARAAEISIVNAPNDKIILIKMS